MLSTAALRKVSDDPRLWTTEGLVLSSLNVKELEYLPGCFWADNAPHLI